MRCVAHGFPGTDTVVDEDGHIGHCAVLHGCVVERNALVGMNAVINDNAVIGESAIVGAMAFVKARMIVPPRMLVAGMPARVVRELTANGAGVENRRDAELPGACTTQPCDDAGDGAARGRRGGPQADRVAGTVAAIVAEVAAQLEPVATHAITDRRATRQKPAACPSRRGSDAAM